MIFSENKLRELANINNKISTDEIVKAINSIGFEVESVESFNKNSGLKFGHVISVDKNPNSNKLTVCRIKFSDKERTIQTAAQNVQKNDYVIAFVPSSKLNGIELKEKEMGKIVSEGMLASLSELGFDEKLLNSQQTEEVVTFKNKIDLTVDPIEFLGLNDNLIDVSILSNRSDAQSYIIFAKELAAFFKSKPKEISQHKNIEEFKSKTQLVSNENNKLFGAEIKAKEFKLDFKDYLLILKSKIKIEDNDFLNFANLNLIYTGVSLRAIDIDKLHDNNISIKEEKNINYLINKNELISTLGIEVNEKFEATSNSANVLFEFSQIDEKIVRDNSKLTKKTTLSSINNSRNISYGSILYAYEFIRHYFKIVSNLINYKNEPKVQIKFNYEYIKNFAGKDIKKDVAYKFALDALKTLGFEINKQKNLIVPLYRHDVANMQNVVEEIFRFYGFNNFTDEQPKLKLCINDNSINLEQTISSLGYQQVWTYTLMNKERNVFNPFGFKNVFNLKTFVSEEFNSIRNSIALPLANVYEYNIRRKIDNLSLFDIGMINDKKSIIISSNSKNFQQIKNDIQKITNQKLSVKKIESEFLHPQYNAGLYLSGKLVGWIGKFHPRFLDSNVIFAEVLEEIVYLPKNSYQEYDQSPLKERDITFSISKDFEHALYLDKLNAINGIFSIEFISSFKKDNINNLTYRIKMNENALKEFEAIDWENKNELFNF